MVLNRYEWDGWRGPEVNACLDEALPLMDYAAGNATEKATAAAVASAVRDHAFLLSTCTFTC